ncbi:thioredoxin-2-like [Paramacrobiotus metropolitanus]|uniref:thioredoxin-2-like n=1 Tax=Paramacrobiotus metropolitanus TaxID=2943436 RepID=UPI002446188B|nr:thioredoxin-2-like [Paramacrobiotus metropolitanus]
MAKIEHVTEKPKLDQILKEAGNKLVVLDFHATWCGPCRNIAPKFEEFANKYDAVFLKVDVDEAEEIASTYEITSMPTFVFVKNGKKVDSFSGADVNKLEQTIKKNL